jgi:hypothetical protein
MGRVTNVELSPAYEKVASELLDDGGYAGRAVRLVHDFANGAAEVEAGAAVVLHRVVCCYPDGEALVSASAERAGRLVVLSLPRDVWWTRLVISWSAPGAPRPQPAGSGGPQEAPQCLADDLRGRGSLRASTLKELLPQLGIQAHGLDACRRGAEGRTPALGPPRDQPIDVVAGLGLGGEGLDLFVGDRPNGAGMAVDAVVGHGSSSLLRILSGVFDGDRMVDGVMDVVVGDTVLVRRVVDLHRA